MAVHLHAYEHAGGVAGEPHTGDAFGRALTDSLEGGATSVVLERDDGWIGSEPLAWYFDAPEAWSEAERSALEFVRGRVIDVASGGGRVALALQERGHNVLATDISPLAIDICRRRGVARTAVAGIDKVMSMGPVDTVTMLGTDLALLGPPAAAHRILRGIHQATGPNGRIVGSCGNPPATDPAHVAYAERNRRFGRLANHRVFRVRYRDLATPWFDYVFRSPLEMATAAERAGWKVTEMLAETSVQYTVLLEKS
jgi:SAM-dependent methyltransferase